MESKNPIDYRLTEAASPSVLVNLFFEKLTLARNDDKISINQLVIAFARLYKNDQNTTKLNPEIIAIL